MWGNQNDRELLSRIPIEKNLVGSKASLKLKDLLQLCQERGITVDHSNLSDTVEE